MSTVTNWLIGFWMMKVFSLFLLLSFKPLWACELKQDTVSLSAPITGILEFMGLLESPRLKAISLFHPVAETKKEKLSGGLFLSQKTIDRFKSHVVYFDESRELNERLKNITQRIEVSTRSQTPFAVTRSSLEKLEPNLMKCDDQIAKLQAWLDREESWNQSQPDLQTTYFFLGTLSPSRWPEYLMVRDGFVLGLIETRKLKTFDSDLAYVRWGEKWKKTLKFERLVGLAEAKVPRVEKLSSTMYNFYFPGALTPGIYQIRFLRFMRENWP